MSSWRFTYWRTLLSIAITGVNILPGSYAFAQIIPDASVDNGLVEANNDLTVIEGGTQVGNNLFYNFSQFSVATGSSAYFNNALGIENIFTRVTGRSISNIDGLIRTNGTANLFFANPNGIVFALNAHLDVGSSFTATTASGLNFADGNGFNAINPQEAPISIIPTQGLQYGESQAGATITTIGNLEVEQDLRFVANKIDLQGKLQAGGGVSLSAQEIVQISNGATITAPVVTVEGKLLILPQGNNLTDFGNQGSSVPINNGGSISIEPSNLGSAGNGGTISVNTSGILIKAKPVPEPSFTFSVFMTAAFYGAWKLKRKQK